MTTLLEVLERFARVEGNRSTLDVQFEHKVYESRITWLVTYELGSIQKLGGRVVVELREISRRQQ